MDDKLLNNRYKLIEQIGTGGMANVYKGKDTYLGRTIAIKMLKTNSDKKKELINRFKKEAQSIAALSHPNIVSIYDIGKEENIDYFIMEYIDGMSLKEKIEKEKVLKWEECITIISCICQALEYAHKKNIMHRDIKPHNILITSDNIAKVADFGLAKFTTAANSLTQTGTIMGSAQYMSPEQIESTTLDERCDIYSLGITFYEMFTGHLPFNGNNLVSIIIKQKNELPIEPYEINKEIPQSVNNIIMKMLEKDPDKRYQTMPELISDIDLASKNINYDIPKTFSIDMINKKHKENNIKEKVKTINKKETSRSKNKNQPDYLSQDSVKKIPLSKKLLFAMSLLFMLLLGGIFHLYMSANLNNIPNDKKVLFHPKDTLTHNPNTIPKEKPSNKKDNTELIKNKKKLETDIPPKNTENTKFTNTNFDVGYYKVFFDNYYLVLSKAIANNNFNIVKDFYVSGSNHYYEQEKKIPEFRNNYKSLVCKNCTIEKVTKTDDQTYNVSVKLKFEIMDNSGNISTSNEGYIYTVKCINGKTQLSDMN